MAERLKNSLLHSLPERDLVMVENGNRLIMEAVRSIEYCDTEKMVLRGSRRLEICGRDLQLEELGGGNMAVVGCIRSILFSEMRG
ncbi:MAG: YabP/YqfC family sporulation protein [Clostridia bacterium]|nr:YabP/YqfC family sporulation protein [Clostridia bacterium]